MGEERGTCPKSAWFDFLRGRIRLSLSKRYYRESPTGPELKVFFVVEDPDPLGFRYGLEARFKHGNFQ